VQDDLYLLPTETRVGSCTVHWLRWYKRFFESFPTILDSLHRGLIRGSVPLEDRKRRAVDRVIRARRISSRDLVVIQRASTLNDAHHISSVRVRTEEINRPWQRLLRGFSDTEASCSIPSNKVCNYFIIYTEIIYETSSMINTDYLLSLSFLGKE
jgi:hypothetical protein